MWWKDSFNFFKLVVRKVFFFKSYILECFYVKVKRSLQLQRRTHIQWNNLMTTAAKLEEVEENMRDTSHKFKSSLESNYGILRAIYTPTVGEG